MGLSSCHSRQCHKSGCKVSVSLDAGAMFGIGSLGSVQLSLHRVNLLPAHFPFVHQLPPLSSPLLAYPLPSGLEDASLSGTAALFVLQ